MARGGDPAGHPRPVSGLSLSPGAGRGETLPMTSMGVNPGLMVTYSGDGSRLTPGRLQIVVPAAG